MYLLHYPSLADFRLARTNASDEESHEFEYTTPDGHIVPRASALLALRNRTAVLVGGLIVGVWPSV